MSRKIENFFILGISLIALLLYSILLFSCFKYTGANPNFKIEFPTMFQDNVLINIIVVTLALAFLVFVNPLIDKIPSSVQNGLLAAVTIWGILFSCIWIHSSATAPQYDQEYMCTYASAFNQGDYTGLLRGEYVGIYQQQLGLITIMRLLFVVFGDGNYKAFQYANAFFTGLLIISGTMIIRNLHFSALHKKRAEFLFLTLIVFCFPLYAYSAFVYGEIISTSLCFFSFWMLLSFLDKRNWRCLIGMVLGEFFSCFVRRNAIIFVIAVGIILLIKTFFPINKSALILFVGTLAACWMSVAVPTMLYASHIPDDSHTMPATLHIAMGLRDYDGFSGWNDGYNISTYEMMDFDPIKANEYAMEDIRYTVSCYKFIPRETLDFYFRKMSTQWNVPMYQALVMNNKFSEEDQGKLAHSIYFGRTGNFLTGQMNYYQLLVYFFCFMFLLYTIVKRKKQLCHIEDYVMIVYIIGGFLFSMMWESKTRYTLPYFIAMLPYAAMGAGIFFSTKWNSFIEKLHVKK